jgi:preprotein translocase subunit SecD
MKAPVTYVPPLAFALSLLLGASAPLAAQRRRAPRDRGGTALLLEVRAEASRAASSVARTAEVIRGRCARLGVYCDVRPQAGDRANRLALRFSTALDAGRVREVLLAEGFELRAVVSPPYPLPLLDYATRDEAAAEAKNDEDVFPLEGYDLRDAYVVTLRGPIITGDDLRNPVVMRAPRGTPGGGYVVDCRLRPAGAARLKAWTSANVGRYVAVVYNGRGLVALYVKAPVFYNVVVSGGFDRRQAEDAAAVLAGGNLPAPVEVLEEGTYNP